jgi:Zn-dependent metalloprotease
MCNCRHSPVQCIVPPYIQDKLAMSSDPMISRIAIDTKFKSYRFRSDRDFLTHCPPHEKDVLVELVKKPKATKAPNLEVYDCKKSTNLDTAALLWRTGSPRKRTSKDAKNVIDAATATWKLYYDLFGRNSIDNLGMAIQQYIHYGRQYDNAFWDGRRMIYGDGDGKIFGSFTSDVDIIGHELTHGVTQYEANLDYHMQAGALNESVSDVFGIMIKQRVLKQEVGEADWLIGENVLIGEEYALRSMKEPGTAFKNHPELGTDPQPATMDSFVKLPDTYEGDWGGVHYNSGIPNYAFYVTAYNLGGYSWEKAGKIWYGTITDKSLQEQATFSDFRKVTVKVAESLFGVNSKEVKAVKAGWSAAKVK